jgi:protoporphyrinogen oxidase
MNKTVFKDNILIGSGLAALGFLELIKKKIKFIVFDKNSYKGGHAFSHFIRDNHFDEGAHICHSKNSFFLKYILENKIKVKRKKSKINNYLNGKKIGYPIQKNIKDLFIDEKIKIFFDFFRIIKKKILNYEDWCNYNYGSYLTNNYYKVYTWKYWRTDMKNMSVDWVNNRLEKKNFLQSFISFFFSKKKIDLSYNTFLYPKYGGFFFFFKNKYKKFNVNLSSKVTNINLTKKYIEINNSKIYKYKNLVSSIPIIDYVNLIEDLPLNLKNNLKKLKYTTLIAFNIKVKKRKIFNEDWCYFYDRDNPISRLSFLDNLKGIKNKKTITIQAEVFRRNDENYDIEILKKAVKEKIFVFLGLHDKNDLLFFEYFIVEKAYPIPLQGTKNIVNEVIKYLKNNQINQIGLYGKWEYKWSDQSFFDGYNFGKDLLGSHEI